MYVAFLLYTYFTSSSFGFILTHRTRRKDHFIHVIYAYVLTAFSFAQLSILEEEYVARRSFWRRQRHREKELSEQQTSLRKQILDDYDVTLKQVSEQMELINEGIIFEVSY